MDKSTYRHEGLLKSVVTTLSQESQLQNRCHMRWQGEPLPSQAVIRRIIELCRSVLFPGFFGVEGVNSYNIEYNIGMQCEELLNLLDNQIQAGLILALCGEEYDAEQIGHRARDLAMLFIAELPELRHCLQGDVRAMYLGDPAAVSCEEVIYCYPAIKAIGNYRIAHTLLSLGVPVIPRMISEMAHAETGIDIHPGAQIGNNFAIDHGTGVVIGATAIIGDNVKIYQGVTLGAKSFDLDDDGNPIKGIPRHPIIGNNVVIYSNATILGRVRIGDGAIIGGNIWITDDVAPGEKLVQAKADNILRFKNDE